MKELKSFDYRLLQELIRDSRRSDRQLAKALGSSQPTVTRRRTFLETEIIGGYTASPKWEKLGYKLFVITLVKVRTAIASKEKYENARQRVSEWLEKQSCVIMAGGCRGFGFDSFMISIHKSYGDYDDFMLENRRELGDLIEDVITILVNLGGKEILRPLSFECLIEPE